MVYSFNLKKKHNIIIFFLNHDFNFLILIWINMFKKKQGKHTTPKTWFLKEHHQWHELIKSLRIFPPGWGPLWRSNNSLRWRLRHCTSSQPTSSRGFKLLPIPCMVYIYLHLMDFCMVNVGKLPYMYPMGCAGQKFSGISYSWKFLEVIQICLFLFFEVGGG